MTESVSTCRGAGVSKFLINGLQDSVEYDDLKASMLDKMLIEFPVFGLNEDYMKALAMVVQTKIDAMKSMIYERLEEQRFNEERMQESAKAENVFRT